MAKVVDTPHPPTWLVWAQTALVGLLVAIIYAILAAVLSKYMIEPLTCGSGNAAQCAQASSLAANVATVLAAAAGIGLAIRYQLARPLFVAIASAVLLWGLGDWTSGLFWLEALGWALVFYIAAYTLFGWLARALNIWVMLGTALVIVIIERIVLAL